MFPAAAFSATIATMLCPPSCPRPARLAVVLAALSACSSASDDGAQVGPVLCDEMVTPLADDDSAALGFSVADVLARFGGPRAATLEHFEGGTTDLTLELHVGAAELVVTSYPEGTKPGDEPNLVCDTTTMQLAVTLDFVTADGVFDETLATTWSLAELPALESVLVDVALADLGGSHTSDADRLSFNITLGEGDPSGAVVGVIQGSETELPTEFNIARFNYEGWPQTF